SITSLSELRQTRVSFSGTSYRLSEIAEVSERNTPQNFPAFFLSQENQEVQKAITFDVYKLKSERIDISYEHVQSLVEKELSFYENTFSLHSITSLADDIDEQFSSLFTNFSITILLVFIVLLLFFGLRQAVIASFTVPLTFLGTLFVMDLFSITLNFLSLFSLLLSLGLLVDVTIVIISAITSYYRSERFTPKEAGLLTWRDYGSTLVVTTLTTVWAFFPLLLATGIIGEFIKPIPIVVSATLLSSLFVGLLIILPFMMLFLKPTIPKRVRTLFIILASLGMLTLVWFFAQSQPFSVALFFTLLLLGFPSFIIVQKTLLSLRQSLRKKSFALFFKRKGISLLSDGFFRMDILASHYKRIIFTIITDTSQRKKTLFFVIFLFVFSVLLLPLGLIKNEFFPKENQDFLYVQIDLSEGILSQKTQERSIEIAKNIIQDPSIQEIHIQTSTGMSADGSLGSSSSESSLLTLILKKQNQRDRSSMEIAQSIRQNYAHYPHGRISVMEVSGGPPAGADIQITLLGEKTETLEKFANDISIFLEQTEGVTNVEQSLKGAPPKIVLVPDQDALLHNGYSPEDISIVLETFSRGFEIAKDVSLDDLGETRNIVLRMTPQTTNIKDLGTLSLSQDNDRASLYSFTRLELQS
ncbi:MAG: efflux RND transporter permease subunit, partial [Candidatus Moranbacteria bacterium]|nr:efflux RND transporter permease subunit [Candidatus Moranbacteria bacterium]